ncbi:p53-induced death domain-containing protein 1 [Stegostoma tigrinum]|uniref:p53-induced death domain-containing protein 1 n=1 Tax=Stegostoma tigrinum TaxID=3053191 RepID=UPI00202B8B11|nr:p53-induced death domain-containing protein 1 [Stegostoma tigrinum]XP_048401664.1 p53-induced death domain-containing protein 1 [Stegostoma tigrinum]XP_048401666.1 p53-induced death domain-containing protein 1 [Stegostoma tigrinum]XP_048401667.1 p53-induced death domain-containing protein 1 [Stegostoma tigrinum]XP_059507886.1 p53-induced death domain-containing protein 1 [Stegostoma tigrinum]
MAESLRGEAGSISHADVCLADNRLNLDVFPNSSSRFSVLYETRKAEVQQVEFLRLNCNDEQIDSSLAIIPELRKLKSLVLKGGHIKDDYGACQRGLVATLPVEFRHLQHLTHLDLSFNSFTSVPECVTELKELTVLLLSHNQLAALPKSIGKLAKLTFLSLMKNKLRELPGSIGKLVALQKANISENELEQLPDEIGNLLNCAQLDLSGNRLTTIPSSLANLKSLGELYLHSNQLVTVPTSLAHLPKLSRLDLQNNSLRSVPAEIQNLPCVNLKGNPIGEAESPKEKGCAKTKDILVRNLSSDTDSFVVTAEGCKIVLPCGIEIHFPPESLSLTVITCRVTSPHPQQVKLRHHDFLLSQVLELLPHGVQFEKEVLIRIPYVPPRSDHRREVVIRTFSDSWSDLDTKVFESQYVACCSVLHFSWFLVISRLKENKCTVPHEGTRLFSSVDPNIKVIFPAGSVAESRRVRMQVLPVVAEELCELLQDQDSVASPLLCLSQNTTDNFLKPVKIQLPLPSGVTGLNLDRSKLHLLHGDPDVQNWNDITNQVVLEFTHCYALFEVDHFSWYWLWYTTKTYVGGIAKKVYERLRKWQVNFVVLQRKKDPEQIFLQCVPKHKVETVCKKLETRYRGPEPSDTVEMFEGEQFFAGFEKGIKIDSDRPDCVDGRIGFTFYSHLKNSKEVYVSTEADRKTKAVKGQVSFYRGSLPENIPEEAAKKRKGPDSMWLATLPIKLPKQKSRLHNEPRTDPFYPPLNLGDEETGYLTEANLLSIARRIGPEWQSIGINLGLSYSQLERIGYNHRDDLDKQILEMLFTWAQCNESVPGCISQLIQAMKKSDREDIAEEIHRIIELGRRKYHDSIRRVGLSQENSNEDSAIAMV